tara:strand:+ start:469 stop:828 length:360 start_codon:yes stop_codon:yes gene_type:complete
MEPDDESKCGEYIHTVGSTLVYSDDSISGVTNSAWSTGISTANITAVDTNWQLRDDTNASLQVNGRDVMKEIDELRDAVLLLTRAVDMEEKYPELKRLKDEYESALDKYKTFDAIKESK